MFVLHVKEVNINRMNDTIKNIKRIFVTLLMHMTAESEASNTDSKKENGRKKTIRNTQRTQKT